MSVTVYLFPNAKPALLGIDMIKLLAPFYTWCKHNVDDDKWQKDGVTVYSHKIIFEDEQDAIMFKLKFGL